MVRLYVGLTDGRWFERLSTSAPHDEVNFWQPNGEREFRVLKPGELFLFKLHAPDHFIVGGGIFSHTSSVPLSLAWDALGQKNGAGNRAEMVEQIARYRRDSLDARQDPVIGCRILTQPFFWPRELWIPVQGWAPNIVQGKGFDTQEREGQSLWDAVTQRLHAEPLIHAAQPPAGRYGAPALITPRLGQGAFRLTITDSYERRCAVSGEKTLPILDAAHIRAYEAGGEHTPSNGLLLRTDIHRLFDLGYVTVSPEGRFEVSRRLKADFDNGRHYYELHGTPLWQPRNEEARPSEASLAWHRENRYRG
jgi:putative restriction endonuclease